MFTRQLAANVLAEAGEWRKATIAYAGARMAFQLIFGEGLNEVAAQDLIARTSTLFPEAAFAAAQLGENEEALALANEGRARMMAVTLKLQTLDLSADKRKRLDELRVAIHAANRAVEAPPDDRASAIDKLVRLRQELLEIVKDADTAMVGAHDSALGQARALAGKGGAVVVPIMTRFGSKILIVANTLRPPRTLPGAKRTMEYPTPPITVIDLPKLTQYVLDDRVLGIRRGSKTDRWIARYPASHLPLLERRKRELGWPETLDRLLPELWGLFAGELDAALKRRGLQRGARVLWLPSGFLGILPLGAAQNPITKQRLNDYYEIAHAPSLGALTAAQARIAKLTPATLAAVINPTDDLRSAELEGIAVASHFSRKGRTILKSGTATLEAVLAALRTKTYWHFATHGTFSWNDVHQSALVLDDDAQLSVGRIFEASGVGGPRLVVLSACETGLHDILYNPDEFVGFPSTFTALGAAGVISTLWPVDDVASSLLIAKFYDLHLGNAQLPPPTALRRAQNWLRDATEAAIRAYANAATAKGKLERRRLLEIEEALSEEPGLRRRLRKQTIAYDPPSATAHKKTTGSSKRLLKPYTHPDFWAGFIYTGL